MSVKRQTNTCYTDLPAIIMFIGMVLMVEWLYWVGDRLPRQVSSFKRLTQLAHSLHPSRTGSNRKESMSSFYYLLYSQYVSLRPFFFFFFYPFAHHLVSPTLKKRNTYKHLQRCSYQHNPFNEAFFFSCFISDTREDNPTIKNMRNQQINKKNNPTKTWLDKKTYIKLIYVYLCVYMYLCVYLRACMYIYISACMLMCVCVCVHLYRHGCVFVCASDFLTAYEVCQFFSIFIKF